MSGHEGAGSVVVRLVLGLAIFAFMAAGCGGGDDEGGSSDDGESTQAQPSSSATSAPPDGTSGADSSATTVAETTVTTAPARAVAVAFDDIQAAPQDFVGQTVELVGKVFFETSCPPPPPGGQPAPCSLTGYLASESVTYLGPAEVNEALAIAEAGRLVSCGDDGSGSCPGWEHGRSYRIVAAVRHLVLGGRETEEIELDVAAKTPL